MVSFVSSFKTEEEILFCRDNSEIPKENYNDNFCVRVRGYKLTSSRNL